MVRRRKRKIRLVRDWQKSWKWLSMQSMAISVAFLGTWELLPEELKSSIPSELSTKIAIGILVFGMMGRLINQDKQ